MIAAVHRDEARAHLFAVLEHAGPRRPGLVGEDLGVAGIGNAGGAERFLVERSGGDGGDFTGHRRLDAREHIAVSSRAGFCAHHPGFEAGVIEEGQVADRRGLRRGQSGFFRAAAQDGKVSVDHGSGKLAHLCVGEKLQADFGSDPGGVAHGDGDEGFRHGVGDPKRYLRNRPNSSPKVTARRGRRRNLADLGRRPRSGRVDRRRLPPGSCLGLRVPRMVRGLPKSGLRRRAPIRGKPRGVRRS